jgi:hypothetical protein
MPDYAQGKIYKIVSDQTDKVYIGSTTRTLAQRLAKHKDNYNQCSQGKHLSNNTTSFEILKHGDAKIILIELFPCKLKCELEAREYFYIQQEKNKVNKIMPTPFDGEAYRAKNKEAKKEYDKMYKENNKERIAIQRKEFYQENKDKIYEKRKDYFVNHRKEKQNEMFECECGYHGSMFNKTRHLKSKKHLSFLNIIDE